MFLFAWATDQSSFEETFFSRRIDIGYHPAMLTSLFLGALFFRTFDVSPTNQTWQVGMDATAELDTIVARGEPWKVVSALGRSFPLSAVLLGQPEIVTSEGATNSEFPDVTGMTRFQSDTGELVWDSAVGQVTLNSARSRSVVGFTDGGSFALGGPGVDCATAAPRIAR